MAYIDEVHKVYQEEYRKGYYHAQGVLMGMSNSDGTYMGDSTDMLFKAARHVFRYDDMPDAYKDGFASGIYSMFRCG